MTTKKKATKKKDPEVTRENVRPARYKCDGYFGDVGKTYADDEIELDTGALFTLTQARAYAKILLAFVEDYE